MKYDNLDQLVNSSSSSRKYFLSLPIDTQIELHKHKDYIHNAAELHHLAASLEKHHRQVQLGGWNYF